MNGQGQQGYLPQVQASAARSGLVRPRQGRIIAGVLAGLARRFGVSPLAARVVFLLTVLLPGPQFLAYLALLVLAVPLVRCHDRAPVDARLRWLGGRRARRPRAAGPSASAAGQAVQAGVRATVFVDAVKTYAPSLGAAFRY